jgi:hypothetical protein
VHLALHEEVEHPAGERRLVRGGGSGDVLVGGPFVEGGLELGHGHLLVPDVGGNARGGPTGGEAGHRHGEEEPGQGDPGSTTLQHDGENPTRG